MKQTPNYTKHLLQWGVLAAIAGSLLWASWSQKTIDVEAYCPFGGLQALGTFLTRNSLACSMSMLQIVMGLVLAVGVILFSRLFCGYLCPLGTLSEWLGRSGAKLRVRVEVAQGGLIDKGLRAVKYALLFVVFYFTLTSSELFCRKFDPYYAVATGFKGELVPWMALTAIGLLIAGSFFIRMFWCRYICPLGAVSNLFKFTPLFLAALAAGWGLQLLGVADGWIWVLATVCVAAYVVEIVKMRSCAFPLLYVRCDAEACTRCGKCAKACPYAIAAQEYVKVKHVDCTLCGECVTACPTRALQINGRRRWRWLPGLLVVGLFGLGLWLGGRVELPTIDEKWGTGQSAQLEVYKLEGLKSMKCYGSSKAFSAQMQHVPGVYGVRTFVKRQAVEVSFDPAQTDTLRIQEAIFTPTRRLFAQPGDQVTHLEVVRLGVEGLHDRMDMAYFAMMIRRIKGVYGFKAEFACPVDVTVYVDPSADVTREQFERAIDIREFRVKTTDGKIRSVPMRTVLRSYALEGEISTAELNLE